MATKHKPVGKHQPRTKRVVAEIAPGVRALLDAYLVTYNEGLDRVSSPVKYIDVVNQALDAFLPGRSVPSAETATNDEEKPGKEKKGKSKKVAKES